MTTELNILRSLVCAALNDDALKSPVAESDVTFENIDSVRDAQHRLRNICLRTLQVSDPIRRAHKEAKAMLLARAEASSTESGLRAGYMKFGASKFYVLANLELSEIVIEDFEGNRAWIKKPDVLGAAP